MDDEIDKEIDVLARRLSLLQFINSEFADDVFDNGTQAETEHLHNVMAQEFPDVFDRFAFLDTLQQAYIGDDEDQPLMITS